MKDLFEKLFFAAIGVGVVLCFFEATEAHPCTDSYEQEEVCHWVQVQDPDTGTLLNQYICD